MAEYIEGKRAVLEAFKTNVPATCLYVAEGSHGDKNVSELVKRAHKMGLSVKQVKRDQLDKRSERGSHQGVMLETKPFEYCSAQALINGRLRMRSRTTAMRSSWFSTILRMRAILGPSRVLLKWLVRVVW